jgi:thiosulfate/3-mercaptopyruvate sulfurtransferase
MRAFPSTLRILTGLFLLLPAACTVRTGTEDGILVGTDWVEQHLSDPELVILHAGTADGYDTAHISGSVLADPYAFTVNTEELYNEVPGLDSLDCLLRSLSVCDDSEILIVYEEKDQVYRAARIFLTLDYLGLGDRTRVLNGGLEEWMAEGKAVSAKPAEPEAVGAGELTFHPREEIFVHLSEVDRCRQDPHYRLVDARSFRSYHGERDSLGEIHGGHIEGAFHLYAPSLFSDTASNSFAPDGELSALFDEAGIKGQDTLVFYCGSGILACVDYLASRHLGYPSRFYDGSFGEWQDHEMAITRPADLPVKTDP